MTMPTLEEVKAISLSIANRSDGRPDWLKAMPHACEPTAPYYRLFYELARSFMPQAVLEIGTYVGTSAAHFAAGCRRSTVVTIDHNPEAAVKVEELGLPNMIAVTRNSSTAYGDPGVKARAPYDILFIDGEHNFNQAYGEYELYRPLIADEGLIFFDDIALPMATREMEVFWEFVVDPKARIMEMHYTGMGVAKKAASIQVPPWKSIRDAATKRMRELGGTV